MGARKASRRCSQAVWVRGGVFLAGCLRALLLVCLPGEEGCSDMCSCEWVLWGRCKRMPCEMYDAYAFVCVRMCAACADLLQPCVARVCACVYGNHPQTCLLPGRRRPPLLTSFPWWGLGPSAAGRATTRSYRSWRHCCSSRSQWASTGRAITRSHWRRESGALTLITRKLLPTSQPFPRPHTNHGPRPVLRRYESCWFTLVTQTCLPPGRRLPPLLTFFPWWGLGPSAAVRATTRSYRSWRRCCSL